MRFSNYSLEFDTTNHVQVPNAASLKNFTELTVLLWIRAGGFTGVSRHIISGGYWTAQGGYLIYCSSIANKISVFLKNSVGGTQGAPVINFTPDRWTQIGLTWDGAQLQHVHNGVKSAGNALAGLVDPTQDLYIGSRPGLVQPYDSLIDEVLILPTVISDLEALELFRAGVALRRGDTRLMLRFEEGRGLTAYDESSYGNDGDLLPIITPPAWRRNAKWELLAEAGL